MAKIEHENNLLMLHQQTFRCLRICGTNSIINVYFSIHHISLVVRNVAKILLQVEGRFGILECHYHPQRY